MVGGRNYAESQYNRAVTAKRQPGSAFKPFVYLTAIEAGLTPETIRQDAPLDVKGWKPGELHPRIFRRGDADAGAGDVAQHGRGAARPRSRAEERGADRAPARHFIEARGQSPRSRSAPRKSRVIELVGAYAPFANGGLGVSPHVVTKIRTNEGKVLYARQPDQLGQVIEPRHVAMMNTMMQETLLSGTARKAEIPGWMAAGKTGTSQDFRDAWFIGYTANLVTGVWLGNDDNSPTKKATGGGLPVEVWTRSRVRVHRPQAIGQPPQVVGQVPVGDFGVGPHRVPAEGRELDRPAAPRRRAGGRRMSRRCATSWQASSVAGVDIEHPAVVAPPGHRRMRRVNGPRRDVNATWLSSSRC